jgi:hypothetical protein
MARLMGVEKQCAVGKSMAVREMILTDVTGVVKKLSVLPSPGNFRSRAPSRVATESH